LIWVFGALLIIKGLVFSAFKFSIVNMIDILSGIVLFLINLVPGAVSIIVGLVLFQKAVLSFLG